MSTITKDYNDDAIQTLEWNEHIRQRPGMYIGNTGDGSRPDDGIYILIKEVLDNSIDEFSSGHGKEIRVDIVENTVTIRDFGRGIPLESVIDCASKLNTGGKFDSDVFQKSVGLNGVGLKAVNATSSYFYIESFREGRSKWGEFSAGNLINSGYRENTGEKNGTFVKYTADDKVFPSYRYNTEFVEEMIKNYSYLNTGLSLKFNGVEYKSKNGLLDLVTENLGTETLYPPIHLVGHDIELVITHGEGNGEDIASFVNGQNTTEGGTHLSAFREAVAKTIKEFSKGEIDILVGTQMIAKGFDFERLGLVAVIAADTLLGVQDFRADEKAMQLLEQFRGRCGRRGQKGIFIIQTSQPEHPIYRSITTESTDAFNTRLLSERKDFDFPPYTRNIEITIKDIYEDRSIRMSQKLAECLKDYNVTGPYAPVISRIADRHIRKIRLSLKKDRQLVSRKMYLKAIINRFEKDEKYEGHISIDVDPS